MSKPPREIWTFRWITNGKYGAFNVGKPTESEKACFLGSAEVIEFRELTPADESKDEALREAREIIEAARDVLNSSQRLGESSCRVSTEALTHLMIVLRKYGVKDE